jgi:hypothetical protein
MAIQIIKQGSNTNPDIVRAIQELLNKNGAELTVDGLFGAKTNEAVRIFQMKSGLLADGIVGEKTIAALRGIEYVKEVYKHPVRGKVLANHEVLDIVGRALKCVGAPIKYHLEYPNGGTDPEAIMPCDEHTGFLDCSGFNAWVQGFDRYQPGDFKYWDGYLNTDSKIAEAEERGVWFTIHTEPEVGDMIVGESERVPGERVKIGHEGTVVDISEWNSRGLAGIQVVHCSPSNYKFTDSKSAVFKTNGALWGGYKKHVFLRFNREAVLALKAA